MKFKKQRTAKALPRELDFRHQKPVVARILRSRAVGAVSRKQTRESFVSVTTDSAPRFPARK